MCVLNNDSNVFARFSSPCFDLVQQRVFNSSGVNQTADVVRIGVVAGPHSGVGERHRLEPNLFATCESSVKLNLEITLIFKYHHIHMAHVHVFTVIF